MARALILILLAMILTLIGCGGSSSAPETAPPSTFDSEDAGVQATGWRAAETNGQGTPATWQIIRDGFAPSPPHVVAVVRNRNNGQTYNLYIDETGHYQNLELTASVRAVAGKEDQGGGVLWRFQDENNYYVARWNPLEGNFHVDKVIRGRRKQLASVDVRADNHIWQQITVRQEGKRIIATFNDHETLAIEDSSIKKPGKIGLWTKADAASFFDEIAVKGLD